MLYNIKGVYTVYSINHPTGARVIVIHQPVVVLVRNLIGHYVDHAHYPSTVPHVIASLLVHEFSLRRHYCACAVQDVYIHILDKSTSSLPRLQGHLSGFLTQKT